VNLCNWCLARLNRRSLLRRLFGCGMCTKCHDRAHNEAGLYLQSGGPPFPQASRLGLPE
jgi:hypothetical protein